MLTTGAERRDGGQGTARASKGNRVKAGTREARSARPHGLAAIGDELGRSGVDCDTFAAEFERVGAGPKPDLQAGRLNYCDYNAGRFELCVNRCFVCSPDPGTTRELQRRYEDAILYQVGWADGARDGFEAAAARHPVAILTNGATRLQHEKLRRLGIVAVGVFVSSASISCQSPHRSLRSRLKHPRIDRSQQTPL